VLQEGLLSQALISKENSVSIETITKNSLSMNANM
jgi:hypothetical protein